MVYNPLTCAGWTTGTKAGWFNFGGECMKSRLGMVMLFFVIALVRKWGADELGIEFSMLWSILLCYIPYLFVLIIFGSFKVAMVIGVIGLLVGGYGGGMFFGGSDDGY